MYVKECLRCVDLKSIHDYFFALSKDTLYACTPPDMCMLPSGQWCNNRGGIFPAIHTMPRRSSDISPEPVSRDHRRRLKTSEKAKVVVSVWGEEFIKVLPTLAVLPRTILNNRMNCTRMI